MPGTVQEKAKRKPSIDLERMGLDYCAGLMTLREIGTTYGLSPARICQLAKTHGWVQDLRARARVKAAALVNEPVKPDTIAVEATVDSVANSMAHVRRQHRDAILQQRELVQRLLRELQDQTNAPDAIVQLEGAMRDVKRMKSQLERNPDADLDTTKAEAKMLEAAQRVISLPGRTATLKTLVECLKILVGLEREAFDLDAKGDEVPKVEPDRTLSPREHYLWLCAQTGVAA